jgi:imidazoleglycerol-phosphate dehydratase
MRKACIERKTSETQIKAALTLDGKGAYAVDTGIGFFDHMLSLFAKHGGFDLDLNCKGDLRVDNHHTVEDVGIVLGQAFRQAMGDMAGITRYADKTIPMDEALAFACVDISGRPFLVYEAGEDIGEDMQLYEEFWRAFAVHAGITLHIRVLYGRNAHHMIEAIFKAAARTMREAVTIDPRVEGIPSTKGTL